MIFIIIQLVLVSESIKISRMCLGVCILQAINRIITIILLMCDNLVRMFIFNVYNVMTTCCQICSVLPLCLVFMVTSNLKCIICNRSNICCAGSQGQCPILSGLVMIGFLYFVLYAFDAVDWVFNLFGFVKENLETSHNHHKCKNITDEIST